MKLLIDTHIFLWYIWGNTKLTVKIREMIDNTNNQKYLSIASLWEIAIKANIGKLKINQPFEVIVPKELNILPIKFNHLNTLVSLPHNHKDPFDRIIISQAISEKFNVLSIDENFKYYDIRLLDI
jgi:PIN domain nuclease of toxin-antitoxin system